MFTKNMDSRQFLVSFTRALEELGSKVIIERSLSIRLI